MSCINRNLKEIKELASQLGYSVASVAAVVNKWREENPIRQQDFPSVQEAQAIINKETLVLGGISLQATDSRINNSSVVDYSQLQDKQGALNIVVLGNTLNLNAYNKSYKAFENENILSDNIATRFSPKNPVNTKKYNHRVNSITSIIAESKAKTYEEALRAIFNHMLSEDSLKASNNAFIQLPTMHIIYDSIRQYLKLENKIFDYSLFIQEAQRAILEYVNNNKASDLNKRKFFVRGTTDSGIYLTKLLGRQKLNVTVLHDANYNVVSKDALGNLKIELAKKREFQSYFIQERLHLAYNKELPNMPFYTGSPKADNDNVTIFFTERGVLPKYAVGTHFKLLPSDTEEFKPIKKSTPAFRVPKYVGIKYLELIAPTETESYRGSYELQGNDFNNEAWLDLQLQALVKEAKKNPNKTFYIALSPYDKLNGFLTPKSILLKLNTLISSKEVSNIFVKESFYEDALDNLRKAEAKLHSPIVVSNQKHRVSTYFTDLSGEQRNNAEHIIGYSIYNAIKHKAEELYREAIAAKDDAAIKKFARFSKYLKRNAPLDSGRRYLVKNKLVNIHSVADDVIRDLNNFISSYSEYLKAKESEEEELPVVDYTFFYKSLNYKQGVAINKAFVNNIYKAFASMQSFIGNEDLLDLAKGQALVRLGFTSKHANRPEESEVKIETSESQSEEDNTIPEEDGNKETIKETKEVLEDAVSKDTSEEDSAEELGDRNATEIYSQQEKDIFESVSGDIKSILAYLPLRNATGNLRRDRYGFPITRSSKEVFQLLFKVLRKYQSPDKFEAALEKLVSKEIWLKPILDRIQAEKKAWAEQHPGEIYSTTLSQLYHAINTSDYILGIFNEDGDYIKLGRLEARKQLANEYKRELKLGNILDFQNGYFSSNETFNNKKTLEEDLNKLAVYHKAIISAENSQALNDLELKVVNTLTEVFIRLNIPNISAEIIRDFIAKYSLEIVTSNVKQYLSDLHKGEVSIEKTIVVVDKMLGKFGAYGYLENINSGQKIGEKNIYRYNSPSHIRELVEVLQGRAGLTYAEILQYIEEHFGENAYSKIKVPTTAKDEQGKTKYISLFVNGILHDIVSTIESIPKDKRNEEADFSKLTKHLEIDTVYQDENKDDMYNWSTAQYVKIIFRRFDSGNEMYIPVHGYSDAGRADFIKIKRIESEVEHYSLLGRQINAEHQRVLLVQARKASKEAKEIHLNNFDDKGDKFLYFPELNSPEYIQKIQQNEFAVGNLITAISALPATSEVMETEVLITTAEKIVADLKNLPNINSYEDLVNGFEGIIKNYPELAPDSSYNASYLAGYLSSSVIASGRTLDAIKFFAEEGLFKVKDSIYPYLPGVIPLEKDVNAKGFVNSIDNFIKVAQDYLKNIKEHENSNLNEGKITKEILQEFKDIHTEIKNIINNSNLVSFMEALPRYKELVAKYKDIAANSNPALKEAIDATIEYRLSNLQSYTKIKDFVLNTTRGLYDIANLNNIDPAFFKDIVDFFKRNKQNISPGKRLNTNAMRSENQTAIVLQDFYITSASNDTIKKLVQGALGSNFTSEEQKFMLSAFSNINSTDGQSYRTLSSFRDISKGMGTWSEESEEVYNKLKNANKQGVKLDLKPSEILLILQAIKPFVYGRRTRRVYDPRIKDYITLQVPVQYKNSESMALVLAELMQLQLLPSSSPYADYFKGIHNFITKQEAKGNFIDVVHFKSTEKVGVINTEVADLTNLVNKSKDGKVKIENVEKALEKHFIKDGNLTNVDILPYKYYSIQVGTPTHLRDSFIGLGTQTMQLITQDLGEDDTVIGQIPALASLLFGKENSKRKFTKGEVLKYYSYLLSIRMLNDFRKLYNKMGSIEDLSKILKAEVMIDLERYGHGMLEALDVVTDVDSEGNEFKRFNLPLYDPLHAERIWNKIMSIIRTKGIKFNITGGTGIIAASTFFSDTLNIKFKKSSKEKILGIDYVPIMMPAYTKKLLKHYYNPNTGLIDMQKLMSNPKHENILEAFGYRIPTENKYSMVPLKIVGFLPEYMGDTVMLPSDYITIAGWDMDIDKLFMLLPHLEEGPKPLNRIKEEYLSYHNSRAKLENQIANIKDIDVKSKEFKKFEDSIAGKELYVDYGFSNYDLKDPSSLMNLSNEQIGNLIIAMYRGILKSNTTMASQLNPGGFNTIKESVSRTKIFRIKGKEVLDKHTKDEKVDIEAAIREIDSYTASERKGIIEKEEVATRVSSVNNIVTSIQNVINANTGTTLVGIAANATTAHSIFQKYKDGKLLNEYLIYNKTLSSLHESQIKITEADRTVLKYISKNIAEFLAASVDNAKDPVLASYGMSLSTSFLILSLIRVGLTITEVGELMSHPMILEIIKTSILDGSELSKAASKVINSLVTDSIRATLISKLPQDFKVTNMEDVTNVELINAVYPKLNIERKDVVHAIMLGTYDYSEEAIITSLKLGVLVLNFNGISRVLGTINKAMRTAIPHDSIGKGIAEYTSRMLQLEALQNPEREESSVVWNSFPQRLSREKTISNAESGVEEVTRISLLEALESQIKNSIKHDLTIDTNTIAYNVGYIFMEELLDQYHFINTEGAQLIFKSLLPTFGTHRALVFNIIRDIVTYQMSTLPEFAGDDIFGMSDSFSRNFLEYYFEIASKYPEEIVNTKLYSNLMIKTQDLEEDQKRVVLKLKEIDRMPAKDKRELTLNWESWLNSKNKEVYEFAINLAKYDYYISGLGFHGSGLMKIAPTSLFSNIEGYQDRLNTIKDSLLVDGNVQENILNFIDQFIFKHTSLVLPNLPIVNFQNGGKAEVNFRNKKLMHSVARDFQNNLYLLAEFNSETSTGVYRKLNLMQIAKLRNTPYSKKHTINDILEEVSNVVYVSTLTTPLLSLEESGITEKEILSRFLNLDPTNDQNTCN